jgi:hypothetical protein
MIILFVGFTRSPVFQLLIVFKKFVNKSNVIFKWLEPWENKNYKRCVKNIAIETNRAFALIPQGPTQQKPWRPCWCFRQKSLIKIILNWNTNMAAVTSCANALYRFFQSYRFFRYTVSNLHTMHMAKSSIFVLLKCKVKEVDISCKKQYQQLRNYHKLCFHFSNYSKSTFSSNFH